MSINARTVGTVRERERERERESYTLVTESAVLFNSLTHTLCLVNNKRLVRKAEKQEKLNKIKIYKQERNLLKR